MLRIDPQSGGVAFDGIRWANDWNLPPRIRSPTTRSRCGRASPRRRRRRWWCSMILRQPGHHLWRQSIGSSTSAARVQAHLPTDPCRPALLAVRSGHHRGGDVLRRDRARSTLDSLQLGEARRRLTQSRAGRRRCRSIRPTARPASPSTPRRDPTNDGRIKPDVSAPSCVASTVYSPMCFNGTSAASPTAAGMAALLLGPGSGGAGDAVGSARQTSDRRPRPAGSPTTRTAPARSVCPPTRRTAVSLSRARSPSLARRFVCSTLGRRRSSARATSSVRIPQYSIIDLPISTSGVIPSNATSVAVNITSTESVSQFYIQALPTLGGAVGAFSTMNVTSPGQNRPNFAVVPLGQGSISIFIPTGGNIIVDAMGYFTPSATDGSGSLRAHQSATCARHPTDRGRPGSDRLGRPRTGGRRVGSSRNPRRDRRARNRCLGAGRQRHRHRLGRCRGSSRRCPPAARKDRHRRSTTSPAATAATHAIVPLGADGTISVYTSNASHIVVDVMGFITDGTAPTSTVGLFVPVVPNRALRQSIGAQLDACRRLDRDRAVGRSRRSRFRLVRLRSR